MDDETDQTGVDQLGALPAPEITRHVTRGVSRLFWNMGFSSLTEFSLKNGRRADVIGLGKSGDVHIVEVKASIEDYRGDRKWPEYREFCDAFYFAVATDFPMEILPAPEECGLILADRFGAGIIRPAPEHRLAAARRKAVTLRFARTAATRLSQLIEEG